ncbi:MAG: DUF262 domain-containing protein [Lentisphaeria bacterium]|nr:DUF262 domain-containing protein [Lentisphaeria bacterium]
MSTEILSNRDELATKGKDNMNQEWDTIWKKFKELFQGSDFKEYDITIQAWLKDGAMYELIKRGTDTPCFELRFWLLRRSWNDPLVTELRKNFPIRDYNCSTYYKNVLWNQRKAITTERDLEDDVSAIREILGEKPHSVQNNLSPEELPVKICSNVTVAELLTWKLRIPDYQRPYSWREKNIRDFLVDIDLWQKDTNKAGIPYHLGTVILKEQKSETYDVIDGQQRLTTLAILAFVKKVQDFENEIPKLLGSEKTYYSEEEIQTLLRAREYIKSSE